MNLKTSYWPGFLLFCIYFLLGCNTNNKQPDLALKTLPPIVIEKKGAEIFQYWEFRNDPLLWNSYNLSPTNLQSYKDSLENLLGKDTFMQTIQRVAFQDISYHVIKTTNGDSINAQLVHSNTLGEIRTINYLEAQLLDYELSRYPLLSHPTEFHGFILIHDSLKLVRVYFAASDQPWPPKPNVILEAVKKDLKQGWTFKYHLHNHYEKAHQFVGILAPSMADAQYYGFLSEKYSLKNALITNGFHTVEIKSSEFPKFKAQKDN